MCATKPGIYFLVTPTDYDTVSSILTFAACETRQCEDVPIMEDMTLEMIESFIVTLERTSNLNNRITLTAVDGEINILDNDGCKYINVYKISDQRAVFLGFVIGCMCVYWAHKTIGDSRRQDHSNEMYCG